MKTVSLSRIMKCVVLLFSICLFSVNKNVLANGSDTNIRVYPANSQVYLSGFPETCLTLSDVGGIFTITAQCKLFDNSKAYHDWNILGGNVISGKGTQTVTIKLDGRAQPELGVELSITGNNGQSASICCYTSMSWCVVLE